MRGREEELRYQFGLLISEPTFKVLSESQRPSLCLRPNFREQVGTFKTFIVVLYCNEVGYRQR